ncbi:hypothetical protein BC834DRAFT_864499 [Gloeopeniophorella convolvens]|nr:hypothetical protein BC834DRAFT_864499 [Gloeopeniophorella convolvens]
MARTSSDPLLSERSLCHSRRALMHALLPLCREGPNFGARFCSIICILVGVGQMGPPAIRWQGQREAYTYIQSLLVLPQGHLGSPAGVHIGTRVQCNSSVQPPVSRIKQAALHSWHWDRTRGTAPSHGEPAVNDSDSCATWLSPRAGRCVLSGSVSGGVPVLDALSVYTSPGRLCTPEPVL